MRYSVTTVQRRTQKRIARFSTEFQSRTEERLKTFSEDPRPPGSRKLQDRGGWRIRVGDYRAVYEIDQDAREVLVVDVGHRRHLPLIRISLLLARKPRPQASAEQARETGALPRDGRHPGGWVELGGDLWPLHESAPPPRPGAIFSLFPVRGLEDVTRCAGRGMYHDVSVWQDGSNP